VTAASEVVNILAVQSVLNESVSKALQALALTTDRYDDALERIYGRLSDLEARLQDDSFSRKVPS
jgi:uncharacterized coiled-coil protein SlyX